MTELVAFFNGVSGGAANAKTIDEFTRSDLGDTGPALDATSKSSYRQRLRDLRSELDEAISIGDSGRAERAQEEIEFLSKELARAWVSVVATAKLIPTPSVQDYGSPTWCGRRCGRSPKSILVGDVAFSEFAREEFCYVF